MKLPRSAAAAGGAIRVGGRSRVGGVGYPVDFRGGPWDRKREEWSRDDPPEVIEVPEDQGGPFLYKLVGSIGSMQTTGPIRCLYEPDPSMAPDASEAP